MNRIGSIVLTMLAIGFVLAILGAILTGCAGTLQNANNVSLDAITAAHHAMIDQAAAALQRAKDWANIEAAAKAQDTQTVTTQPLTTQTVTTMKLDAAPVGSILTVPKAP